MSQAAASLLAIPLPRFRQPISDPPLPVVETEQETAGPSSGPHPAPESPGPLPPSSQDDSPAPPPVLSPDHPTRTGTSSRPGDPKLAGEVVAGLIALACGVAFTWFGRRGYAFRQPTERQVDDVALPVGRIIARHLPTDVIGPDFIDFTKAAGATHRYIVAEPLLTRFDQPLPEDLAS